MKMTKVLAAVMAGTMVFATAAPVFAGSQTLKSIKDGWWWKYDTDGDGTDDASLTEDEIAKTAPATLDLEGDGTWTVAMKCLETDMMKEDPKWQQRWVITGDIFDDNNNWVTYGTNGSIWAGGSGAADFSGQNEKVDFTDLKPDDVITFQVTREGANFSVNVAVNGKDRLRMKATNSNLAGDVIHTRVVAQYGDFELFDMIEGETADAYEIAKGDTEKKTETKKDTEKKEEKTSEVASNESSNSGSDTATTTTQATTKTGDEAPIIAIIVALAGCGAIAFASKKRFVR